MMLILVLALLTSLALPTTENANTRVVEYQTFKSPVPLNMSEDDMKIKDLTSFVRHHGNRQLRQEIHEKDPDDNHVKGKLFELMKQAIYAAQDRVKHLENILNKYAGDAVFRLGFMFNKLDQLLEDLKRIYTIAVNEKETRNRFHVIYYQHATKKNIDITYIVEYLITYHNRIYDTVGALSLDPNQNKDLNLDFNN